MIQTWWRLPDEWLFLFYTKAARREGVLYWDTDTAVMAWDIEYKSITASKQFLIEHLH